MRRIRTFGMVLLALFAFGATCTAAASAAEGLEAGLLFLPGEEGPVTVRGQSGTVMFKDANGAIVCTSSSIEGTSEAGKHITLVNDSDWDLSGCKGGKLTCNTEGDLKEVILILIDWHFVNLLEGTKLRPGIAWIVLNSKLEAAPIQIKCGIGIDEIRGAVFGLLLVSSLTADVSSGTLDFPTSLKCDTSDSLCKSLEGKPFEINLTGLFGAGQLSATFALEFSKMVEVDD